MQEKGCNQITYPTTGTIGGYGVCSNTLALPAAADHISLTDIIKACSDPSNFVAAQVPFNLFEREAIVASENDERRTVAEIAKVSGAIIFPNARLLTRLKGK